LAYCNLKPAAKEAAAAAAAVRRTASNSGSRRSSRACTPTPNGLYPDPDLDLDLVSDDQADDGDAAAAFSSPLTSPAGSSSSTAAAAAAAAAAAGVVVETFEECISSSSSSGFLSPTESGELAGIAEDSSSSVPGGPVAAALAAAAASMTRGTNASSSSKTASGAADAAAAAAAAQWDGSPLHLSMCVSLGPLFSEDQQGPCLARLLELFVQYNADTNAAAQQLGSVLEQQLQQQQSISGSSSSSYSYRYGSSSRATAAAAEQGVADLPGSSRLLVLLMGLYHWNMRQQQQRRQQQQQWLKEQQQQQHGRPPQCSSSSSVYDDQDIRLHCCTEAVTLAGQLPDLLWYCTLQPDATAGLSSSSSSSSKRVCPIAAELLHEHMHLTNSFTVPDCDLFGRASPSDLRSHTLLGFRSEVQQPGEPRFTKKLDCWRALSETCDGCGRHSKAAADLHLCTGCECAVFCSKCIASAAHTPQVCAELWTLQSLLNDSGLVAGLEMCRCESCVDHRRKGLLLLEVRPRFSMQQQMLVPWQHLIPQQQQQHQQRAKVSPGWLKERPQQQQQQSNVDDASLDHCRLLLPVTVLSPDQAADLKRNPLTVSKEVERQRQQQYKAAWGRHMTDLQVSTVDGLAEYQKLRLKEEQRLRKEGQKDSSKPAAAAAGGASGSAAAAASFFANAVGAGFRAAHSMGMGFGGMGQQQQQRGAGFGARFGANPYQGVGLPDDKLFGRF
jgi:hypothetical protein